MDFKLEVIIRDIARGDLDSVLDYLDERGPEFDAEQGDFDVRVWQRENEARQWFTVTDEVSE